VESEGEEYTQVAVQKEVQGPGPTEFGVFWLVPNHSYEVEVEIQGAQAYTETVEASELGPGETFWLNGDLPIVMTP